jgi:hypothetical protein
MSPTEVFMQSLFVGYKDPVIVDRSLFFEVKNTDRVIRITLETSGTQGDYDCLHLKVISTNTGILDQITLKFKDYLEPQHIWHPCEGNHCHVVSHCGWEWYSPKGTNHGHPKTLTKLHDAIAKYFHIWD